MSEAAENGFPFGFDVDAAACGVVWLDRRRTRALRDFRAAGIPHRRVEEWKYSDLRNALEAPRAPATLQGASADPFSAVDGPRILISDGLFDSGRSDRSLPKGIDVLDLAALRDDTPDWVKRNFGEVLKGGAVGQASFALMRGGIALRVSGEVSAPVHLRFVQHEDVVHARVLVVVEPRASLVLLESHVQVQGMTNLGVEFVLEPNARLTHVRLAAAAPDAVQVEEIGVRAARAAQYRGHFSQAGAKLSRLGLSITLEDEGAEAELSGVGALGRKEHSDITTHVTHAVGKTASRQLFKYVAGDHARAVYQGKITVAKGADGSDSRQTAKAILLGERAEADLKPELEILADDVKCAHGAAVGDLDADSLFYLRSRGLPETEARGLLLRAFLEEAVAEISAADVRGAVWRFVENGLARAAEVPQ